MGAVPRLGSGRGRQRRVEPVVGRPDRRCVDAEVELREMEAEGAGAGTQVGEAAVRDPLTAMGSKQRIELVEIRDEHRAVGIVVGAEPFPDRDEHGPERLVGIAHLGHAADHGRRHSPRRAEIPQLGTVEIARELPRTIEGIGDRLRSDVRVAVEVPADPAAEAQRLAGPLQPLDESALELRDRIPEALLEEPEPLPDLVDDPRALGADLVRLPEQRDLLGEAVLQAPPLRERCGLVVESRQERGNPAVRLEHGPARCLRRMRGEDELDPEPCSGLLRARSSRRRCDRAARTRRRATRAESAPSASYSRSRRIR